MVVMDQKENGDSPTNQDADGKNQNDDGEKSTMAMEKTIMSKTQGD